MIEKSDSIHANKASGAKKHVTPKGLSVTPFFTDGVKDPFDEVEWELRTAEITGESGKVHFRQENAEVPKFWSQTALNIVAQKYFRGTLGTPEREHSVRQIIARVANTITDWGKKDGYFATDVDAEIFRNELKHLLVYQKMAFNSPVWFNVGVHERPQSSACFINSVEDSMESILTLAKTEGMLFKYGSGTGTNLSPLRSSKEGLRGGGISSGPVSFMKGFDAFAGVIKSGGTTRRAAKMVILNINHPDIVEFINCKVAEEKKAWALIDAGYDGSFTGEAYASVFFQNANNSVRVTDDFMKAVEHDRPWDLIGVTTGKKIETVSARDLWRQIADAAWVCGDPGLQYDTTINNWNTSSNTDRINASNPCAEFLYLDNTACNLASLNLMKFRDADGELDTAAFKHAVDVTILGQEILVGNSSYPTEKIAANSHALRPLGLGYANLGALLMARGLPYDSDAGRAYAGAITALMHGQANWMSARIAKDATGPFAGYEVNKEPFNKVMKKHREAVKKIDSDLVPYELMQSVHDAWDTVVNDGPASGFRNGQVTVLAPTGTIGFMMDCDTTGIEPDIALVKYKRLVGGGMLKIVNNTVPEALERLGYSQTERNAILHHIDTNDTIEGAPGLKQEHLPVFDCAFKARNGSRSIHYMGHIRMMAATQPFLSGAISKTVNLPNDCTVLDIQDAYMEAWKLGLKAIAVYRDGCKRSQPLSTNAKSNADGTTLSKQGSSPTQAVEVVQLPVQRRKLSETRDSVTHRFSIGGHDGYLIVGKYDDGTPGELFIRMSKEGSTIAGLMDSFAIAISIALQHGVPLKLLVDKFENTRFEPSGWTGNQDIPRASSIMDYVARWLGHTFLKKEMTPVEVQSVVEQGESSALSAPAHKNGNGNGGYKATWKVEADAPPCPSCGSMTVRNGACHKCMTCGESLGCS